MKIKNLFILSSLALAAASCSESQDVVTVVTSDGEVEFGATLDETSQTRTVYGEKENNAYPIYWNNGDQMLIYSPTVGMDEASAVYQAKVSKDNLPYADEGIEKVNDIGVRWGKDVTKADFYSVYPAEGASISGTTATLTMPKEQNITIKSDGTCNPNMNGCIMYAVTKDAANDVEHPKVELTYKPMSSALRFTLTSGTQEITISRVVLRAPEGTYLTGTFTANLDVTGKPVASNITDGSNEVIMYAANESGAYITLGNNAKVELNAFIIPQENLNISSEWKMEVDLSNGQAWTLSLASATEGETAQIKPGMVHELLGELPELSAGTWDKSKWMTYIPRNVYLSEISLPGSWNSLNSEFQATTDIAKQYEEGVRAFHLDTRWRATKDPDGIADANIYSASDKYVGDLSVADSENTVMMKESWYLTSTSLGRVMKKDNPTFATRLSEITSKVAEDEYMVVLCTFAQGSYKTTTKTWMQAISDACKDNTKVYDGSKLTKNTVVGDVLGHVIVIVCCEDEISNIDLPSGSKCVFTYLPQTLTQANCTANYNDDAMYYGNKTPLGLSFYNTQAQVTATGTSAYSTGRGWAPSIAQRQNQVTKVMNKSKEYYGSVGYANDHWYYLGLGGQTIDSGEENPTKGTQKDVASQLNPYINNIVTAMDKAGSYYPVGIVLMNYATTDTYSNTDVHGLTTVENIIELNNKFKKAADENWKASQSSGAKYKSYNAVVTDNKVNAISWTSGK